MTASEFTHLDPLGRARMVDVTSKEATHRRAIARCKVRMTSDTASKIASGAIAKGDVLAVARVAGIQAAKQTPSLLPLCHPLLVGSVFVNFQIDGSGDYRLQPYSAGVDAGTTDGAPPDDITGTPRPRGQGVDVGVFEQ